MKRRNQNKKALQALVCDHTYKKWVQHIGVTGIPEGIDRECAECQMVIEKDVICNECKNAPARHVANQYRGIPPVLCGTCHSQFLIKQGEFGYEDAQAKYIRENPHSSAPRQYVKKGYS